MHTFHLPDEQTADLVLILNAGYMSEPELKAVTHPGSIVAVNEWHGAASYIKEHCPGFEFMKVFPYRGDTLDLHAFKRMSED